jgi:hypothetical protein
VRRDSKTEAPLSLLRNVGLLPGGEPPPTDNCELPVIGLCCRWAVALNWAVMRRLADVLPCVVANGHFHFWRMRTPDPNLSYGLLQTGRWATRAPGQERTLLLKKSSCANDT